MYLVIELQTNNGKMANICTAYEKREEAESKYHQILSAAALSNIQYHAAAIINERALMICNESYEHGVTA